MKATIKKVHLFFTIILIVLFGLGYHLYSSLSDILTSEIHYFLSELSHIYPEILLESHDVQMMFPPTFVVVFVGLVLVILLSWYLIVRSLKKHDMILDDLNERLDNNTMSESQYEGRYGTLEDGIYALQKYNQKLINDLSFEKEEMKTYIENVAHQMKTPLTAIRLNEEMAQFKNDTSLLEKNVHSFSRIDNLLEVFLKLSRLEYGSICMNLEKNHTKELFKKLEQELESINTAQISYDIEDVECFYDEKWLLEALYNIMKNCIEVSAEHIYVTCRKKSHYLHITIQDDGPGIKEEDLPHIFNRFYRSASKKAQGTGIGLALCKEIIQKHHGDIYAYNNHGACFDITIALYDIKGKVD